MKALREQIQSVEHVLYQMEKQIKKKKSCLMPVYQSGFNA